MKKVISILCTIASFALICDAINIWHNAVMFLIAGIVPGTSVILSGVQMLILISVLAGLFFTIFVIIPVIRKVLSLSLKQNNHLTRKLSRARA